MHSWRGVVIGTALMVAATAQADDELAPTDVDAMLDAVPAAVEAFDVDLPELAGTLVLDDLKKTGDGPGTSVRELSLLLGLSRDELLALKDVGVAARTSWVRSGVTGVRGEASLPVQGAGVCRAAGALAAVVFLYRTPKATGEVWLRCQGHTTHVAVEDAAIMLTTADDAGEAAIEVDRIGVERR